MVSHLEKFSLNFSSSSFVACVASVSVRFGSIAALSARFESKELPGDKKSPSYFCSRPIFRAGKTPKTPFVALCSTETLATQATSFAIRVNFPHS